MSELANLQILVDSKGAKTAERELDKLEKQSKKTERATAGVGKGGKKGTQGLKALETQSRKTTQATNGLASGAKAAGGAIAAYFTVQTAIGVLKTADSFNLLQKRVERLADSSKDGAAKYQALTDIAVSSGSDMKATVQLWEQLDQTLGELGKSDADVIQLTETLNKLGVVGASSVEDMKFSMRQFSQAMAGGVMRAEEFNSIIENTPEVARAMARGLGMSMGEMRAAMLDGELTADKVFDSLMSQTEDTNEEFGKMPRTIAQASTALSTNFGNAVSRLDKQIGASSSLVMFIDFLSGEFEGPGEEIGANLQTAIDRLDIGIEKKKKDIEALQGMSTGDVARKQTGYSYQKKDTGSMAALKNKEIEQANSELERIISQREKLAADLAGMKLDTISEEESPVKPEKTKPVDDSADQEKLQREADSAAKRLAIQEEQADAYLTMIRQRNMEESELLTEKEDAELQRLDSLLEQKLISQQEYGEAVVGITENYSSEQDRLLIEQQEREAEAREAKAEAEKSALELWLDDAEKSKETFEGMWGDAFTSFTSGFGNAVADSIVDGKDFGDTMDGIAKGFAKGMISSLVQIGAQEMVLWTLRQTLGAAAGASALTAVSAQAATSVQMAGLNAFQATAAIPIVGPILAPAAAVAAMAVAAPMGAAAIAAAATGLAGSRSHGGQVIGGSSYLVGEFGPEVLTMPGNGAGSITPNHKTQSGSSGINAITLSPQIVVESGASQSNDAFLAEDIAAQVFNMVLSDANTGGVLSRTLRGR